MALTIQTLNALVKEKSITTGFINQIYEYSPLLNHFKEGKAMVDVSGGNRIMASIQYGTISGSNWSGSGDIPTVPTRPELATEAWYDWAFYNNSSLIPYKEWLLVQKGAYSVADFAKMILDTIARTTAMDFEGKFWANYNSAASGAGSNNKVFGIHQLVGDSYVVDDNGSTHVYVGGIYTATDTIPDWWKSHVFTYDTDKTLILNLMHAVNTLTYKWGKPTIILTNQTIYEQYCEDAYNKSGYLVKDEVATSLGFSVGASFNGIPFVFTDNSNFPSGTIYLLNNEYMKFVVHPDANFKLTPWTQKSTTNYDYVALEDTTYSMVLNNRNAQGKITGVTF